VVVVFELVPHRQDRDGGSIFDLEQRNVVAVAKRDQQLAQERARAGLAVDERRATEALPSLDDGVESPFCEFQIINGGAVVEQVFVKELRVIARRGAVPDGEGHPRTRFEALASICPSSVCTLLAAT